MAPNKTQWLMGYNNLGLLMEQERQHWLLKTDKKKQIQDKISGDVHLGQIDNLGTDIILNTEKLPIQNDVIPNTKYLNPAVDLVLTPYSSAFTYSTTVDGLLFARILSTNFPLAVGTETEYKHYKLKLTDCTTVTILFGGSLNTANVFAGRWLRTTTVPSVLMLDENGQYTIERTLDFNANTTNPVFYYPLETTMQPFPLTGLGSGTYTTAAVNNDGYIGMPLYWFTSDQSRLGPTYSFSNSNVTAQGRSLLRSGNPGNASKYISQLFPGIDGSNNATPDGSSTVNYEISCTPATGYSFNHLDSDYDVPLSMTITFTHKGTSATTTVNVVPPTDSDTTLTMDRGVTWTYVSATKYKVDLAVFDQNCLNVAQNILIPAFRVHLDETLSFEKSTTDIGFAGIQASASNPGSDVYPRYPYDLNEWDGLPEWLTDMEADAVPQHCAMYAIHNTPAYVPGNPSSRQVAAILLDPGLQKTDATPGLTNDQRGRAYLISNDPITYENNGLAEFQKPARTIARICDIPTSVMQLSNISGLAPTSIVDPKYVRSSASYKESDRERLYNTLGNRWVRPTSQDHTGTPITSNPSQDNDFVFVSTNLLNQVDLISHNDFRIQENLNPMVSSDAVSVSSIVEAGAGYAENDLGVVVVGGFAFHYSVASIGEGGSVASLTIAPATPVDIHLSNFDMTPGASGITDTYGTSPLTGSGTGLKFKFIIANYESLLQYDGEIFSDLYAIVRESTGLFLYRYIINQSSGTTPRTGTWTRDVCISPFEESTTNQMNGGLSTVDSYVNSIVPNYTSIPVAKAVAHSDPIMLQCVKTASCINVIDYTRTPIANDPDDTKTRVDLTKFYCEGLAKMRTNAKNVNAVISVLRANKKLRYDSYVIWKWENEADPSNMNFTYGIIHRSINNYMSTDFTTTLPVNELKYPEYVHTNESTTIVWNVNKVGSMVWMYDPSCSTKETYNLSTDTNQLDIVKTAFSWNDVDVRDTTTGTSISLVTQQGTLAFNIITNNPRQASSFDPDMTNPDPIYLKPEFTQLSDLVIGTHVSDISPAHMPVGGWKLVYPRIESFQFVNSVDGRVFNPVQLQVLKGRGITMGDVIRDEYGLSANGRILVMNDGDTGVTLKAYDTQTSQWVTI
jgi:hypothetical protein